MNEQPAFNLPEFYTNSISVAQPNILAFYPKEDFKSFNSIDDYIKGILEFSKSLDNVTVIVTLSASMYAGPVKELQNICSPGFPVLSDWSIFCHETYQFEPQGSSKLIIYSPGLDLTKDRSNIIAIADRSKYIKIYSK